MGFSDLLLKLAADNPSMHGDGPVMFALFDGAITKDTSFLHLDVNPCVRTYLQTTPLAPTVDFTTTVEGNHNVLIALFDYASGPTFPGKGTMASAMSAIYPQIDIRSDSWTATKQIAFVAVPLGPVTDSTVVDKLKCE